MPYFVSFAVSIAELAHEEKSRTGTQSINHSPSIFDAPGTEAFALECKGIKCHLEAGIVSRLDKGVHSPNVF